MKDLSYKSFNAFIQLYKNFLVYTPKLQLDFNTLLTYSNHLLQPKLVISHLHFNIEL